MDVRSLGLQTDLALLATRGQVIDRGDYLVAITPEDPAYYHGNLLVLPAAPQAGELARWRDRFAREIAVDPAVRHVTLYWDSTAGERGAEDELAAAGFELETTHVMSAPDVRLAPPPPGIELRPLGPDELVRAAELGFAIGDAADAGARPFLHRRAAWQRELVARGIARFWGAFDDHTLVGSLGLATFGALARYQDVQTARSHRRRGIAAALLATAARQARATGVEQLVIVTVSGSDAERIYARAGLCTIERLTSACRRPDAISG